MPTRKTIVLSMVPGLIAIAALVDELLLPNVMLPWSLIGSAVLGFGSVASGVTALQVAGRSQPLPQPDFQAEPSEAASGQDHSELQQLKGRDEAAADTDAAPSGEPGDGG